jgi:CheY-like chemotaxis protein
MLQALGCRAKLAGNGEECLEAIRKEHFDLVLMDCQVIISPPKKRHQLLARASSRCLCPTQMPVMDGFRATRVLRERENVQSARASEWLHTPVVAITASATAEYKQKCIDAGMDDWMPKPFDKNKLCRVLNRWLGNDVDDEARLDQSGVARAETEASKKGKQRVEELEKKSNDRSADIMRRQKEDQEKISEVGEYRPVPPTKVEEGEHAAESSWDTANLTTMMRRRPRAGDPGQAEKEGKTEDEEKH